MAFSNTSMMPVPYQTAANVFNWAAGGSTTPGINQMQLYGVSQQLQQQWVQQNQSMRHLMIAGQMTPSLQPGLNGSVMQLQGNMQNTSSMLNATTMIGQNFTRIAALDPYAAPYGYVSRDAMQRFENLNGQPGFSLQDIAMLPPGYPMMGGNASSFGSGSMMMPNALSNGMMTNPYYWGS